MDVPPRPAADNALAPPLTTRAPPLETPARPATARPAGAQVPAAAMKLTRKMVLSRAKASELHHVRKLNCW